MQTTNKDTSLTLPNLSDGEHNVTIYAQDEFGVISAPSTVYFNVKVFPFATIVAVSGAVIVVVIIAGLLVYFTHVKRKRRPY
jgi:hypothetical protein